MTILVELETRQETAGWHWFTTNKETGAMLLWNSTPFSSQHGAIQDALREHERWLEESKRIYGDYHPRPARAAVRTPGVKGWAK